MNLSNPSEIKKILSKYGFQFKKSLGQNFLTNPNVCPQMSDAALSNGADYVIEIGPGIGVLTVELAKRAKKVVTIELDERLRPVLAETLEGFDNVEIVFGDVMKIDLKSLIAEKFGNTKVAVCANLPYYITSPIVMSLLENDLPISSITVMIQKEAARRICAPLGSREAGAVTAAVYFYSRPEMIFDVDRSSFTPSPNVDSTVISLKLRDNPPVKVHDEKNFLRFVRSAFGQRRKTLINSVSSLLDIEKASLALALEESGLDPNIRAEKLTMEDFGVLYENLQHYVK